MKKQQWTIEKIAIKDLILWDNNPRTFDKNYPNPNETEIISRYNTNKLLKIAKNILKYQDADLQPGELTAIQKGSKYVVYDGNRRISVYKILLNPNLIDEKKSQFERLSRGINFKKSKKLIFNVAPDIESALERIGDLHNDNFHENWNSIAQSNFDALGIDGVIKELKAKKIHAKRTALYQKIKSFNYGKDIASVVMDPEAFNITSLERIVNSTPGKKYLNFDFNEKGEMMVLGTEKDFSKILKRVVEDVALGIADSRKQRLNRDKEKYFKDVLIKLNISSTKEGKGKPRSNVGEQVIPLDRDWITSKLYSSYQRQGRVKRLLKEMQGRIPDKDYENIPAILLRVLLEMALYEFLEENGHIAKIINDEKAKAKEENEKRIAAEKPLREWKVDWSPDFKQMLKYIAEEDSGIISATQIRKNLKIRIAKDKTYLDELNAFIHNSSYTITAQAVIDIWKELGRLIFDIIETYEKEQKNKNS